MTDYPPFAWGKHGTILKINGMEDAKEKRQLDSAGAVLLESKPFKRISG
jgi:hypothetical protein